MFNTITSPFSSGRRRYIMVLLPILSFLMVYVFVYSQIAILPKGLSFNLKRAHFSFLSDGIAAIASDFPTYSIFNKALSFNRSQFNSNPTTSSLTLRRDRVIAYLVTKNRVDELSISLESLFRYYNDRFRFHVLLFHETGFNVQRAKESIGKRISNERLDLLEFHQVIGFDEFPPGFDIRDNVEQAKRENIPDSWRYPGYHHMCSFWFRKLFLQPRMASVEYYMRLDTDSMIRAPIDYDLFDFVHQTGNDEFHFFNTENTVQYTCKYV